MREPLGAGVLTVSVNVCNVVLTNPPSPERTSTMNTWSGAVDRVEVTVQ